MKVFRVTCGQCSLWLTFSLYSEASHEANVHGFSNVTHIPVLEAVEE